MEELNELTSYLNSNQQENIIIYGRRRIGKSELIKEALRVTNKSSIFYQATETSQTENIRALSKVVGQRFNLGNVVFESFEAIFDFLFSQKDVYIFVIDEYPYLSNVTIGVDSIIQKSIDTYKNTSKLKVVCK